MDDATALDRMRTLEARVLGLPDGAGLAAVQAGVERLRAQLAETRSRERDEVFTTSIPDCSQSRWMMASSAFTHRLGDGLAARGSAIAIAPMASVASSMMG